MSIPWKKPIWPRCKFQPRKRVANFLKINRGVERQPQFFQALVSGDWDERFIVVEKRGPPSPKNPSCNPQASDRYPIASLSPKARPSTYLRVLFGPGLFENPPSSPASLGSLGRLLFSLGFFDSVVEPPKTADPHIPQSIVRAWPFACAPSSRASLESLPGFGYRS